MFLEHIIKRIFLIIIVFVIISFQHVYSEEIDERYLEISLRPSDVKGYSLKIEGMVKYGIGSKLKIKTLSQEWRKENSDEFISIRMCLLDSRFTAYTETNYYVGSAQAASHFGSFTGSVRGDFTWNSGYGISFIRGNVAVQISSPPAFFYQSEAIRRDMITMTDMMLTKIETNLSPEVKAQEENMKLHQISALHFQTLCEKAISSKATEGFSELRETDSIWLVDENKFTLGRRKEWRNEQGMVIGINICEFESPEDSQASLKLYTTPETYQFGELTYHIPANTPLFSVDDSSSVDTIIEQWSVSFIGSINGMTVKDRIALHVYCFNPDTSNSSLSVFKSVATDIASSLKSF